MASDIAPWFGNKILRHFANQGAMPSMPAHVYLALFNGNPRTTGSEIGATVNPSSPRQEITFAALAAGAAHLLTSNNAQDWGNSAGGTTLTHLGVFDDPTPGSGNMYFAKPVAGSSLAIASGSSVKFNSGATTFNVGSDS
jgi:hypothetical protein